MGHNKLSSNYDINMNNMNNVNNNVNSNLNE